MSHFEAFRAYARRSGDPPHVLVQELANFVGRDLDQKTVVAGITRCFPSVPLEVALETAEWHRVCDCELSDEAFDALLGPLIAADLAADEQTAKRG